MSPPKTSPPLSDWRYVEMAGAEGHHAVDERLQPFGDEGLQHMALDRQAQPGHLGDPDELPAAASASLPQPMKPLTWSRRRPPGRLAADAGDLAILDDVDPALSAPRA